MYSTPTDTKIEKDQTSIEFTFLDERYRVTKYHDVEVVSISTWDKGGVFSRPRWKLIYFGHVQPLEKIVDFFKNTTV